MTARCAVCDEKGTKRNILTQHHHHWPRTYIFEKFGPEKFRAMRTFIQWVCNDCHVSYNNHYLHECYRLGCRECGYEVICRYSTIKGGGFGYEDVGA